MLKAGLNSWERATGTKEALDPGLVFAFITLWESKGFVHRQPSQRFVWGFQRALKSAQERQNKYPKHPNINKEGVRQRLCASETKPELKFIMQLLDHGKWIQRKLSLLFVHCPLF